MTDSTNVAQLPRPRKPARKPASKSRKPARRKHKRSGLETTLIATVGAAVPALGVSLVGAAGHLIPRDLGLAILLGGLAAVVLATSLSHLAEALERLARAPRWRAWTMAVCIDASMMAAELVASLELTLAPWALAMVGSLGALSIALNCHSLLRR